MTEDLTRYDALPTFPNPDVPQPESYRLRIDGLVAQPAALSVADLESFPPTAITEDFTCLEGWVVPDLGWHGVLLGAVLDRVGVLPEARWVQISAGEFSLPLPLEEARGALLALRLDGQPLTAEHGAPVRLLVPGGECFTSVKWLDHVEMRAEPAANTARDLSLDRLESAR